MHRLILDAHVSGRVVGEALRREGHDVFPVDQRPDLEGLSDGDLLALAVAESRILITANVRHFLPLITDMAVRGESHPGCILISRSVRSEDFGAIISGVVAALGEVSQAEWGDRVVWVSG